jgi:hypothetical protein
VTPSKASQATFRIATFVNDQASYGAMLASFEQAGFVAPETVYEILSDASEEPHAAIRRLGQAPEPYVVLVHQDVRCDQGHGIADLRGALAALTERDSNWAVAGNAGGTTELRVVRNVSDPWGTTWTDALPAQVVSLDEDILILRTEADPTCSTGLAGFHLYGTDVCLNARTSGRTSYVIDFRLTHLSGGSAAAGYRAAEARLSAVWAQSTWFSYLRTPNSVICVSRVKGVSPLFGAKRFCIRLEDGRWPCALYARLYRGWLT